MKILIGKIVKPQGVKGELKVYPADTNLDIYKKITTIYFENSDEPIKLTKISLRQGFMYITFKGCNSRNDAENYRNKQIFAQDDEINLQNGTYFIDDLINLDIVDQYGNNIGTIVDIESYGAADVITILEDKREYKVSFLTSIFVKVLEDVVIVDKQKYDEAKICE